jgi:hypothetical protein
MTEPTAKIEDAGTIELREDPAKGRHLDGTIDAGVVLTKAFEENSALPNSWNAAIFMKSNAIAWLTSILAHATPSHKAA